MIEQGFADCEKMGVTGSPWRLYVEPNTKEIFYHNFDTDEQLTWGNIEEKDYQRIYLADVFGASEYRANKVVEPPPDDPLLF